MVILEQQVENNLAAWFEEHEEFYNKRHSGFMNRAKKIKAMEEVAKDNNLTEEEVRVWWSSMRTTYGRLSRAIRDTPSGSGAKEPSERNQWILRTFKFLETHIIRQPGRQTCSVSLLLLFKMYPSFLKPAPKVFGHFIEYLFVQQEM